MGVRVIQSRELTDDLPNVLPVPLPPSSPQSKIELSVGMLLDVHEPVSLKLDMRVTSTF